MESVTFGHYLAGVVGLALMRNWYVDGDINESRVADLSDVLTKRSEFPYSLELDPAERNLHEGYTEWAETYDGPNPMIETEQAVVLPMLEEIARPGAIALDAACGTGRHAEFLVSLGCVTVGLDQSEAMLDVARRKVPGASFEHGDVEHMPFDDDSFDLAVVALALCHSADPTTAVVELGRVLRPGGTLVIADPHPMGGVLGGQAYYGGIESGRTMTYVRNHRHSASTWLRAFRTAGLTVVDLVEVPFTDEQIAGDPSAMFYPQAARGALDGLATIWVWRLSLTPNP
jgi:ubiquinone/menaquinone biosynthesis C-methylase UbiE